MSQSFEERILAHVVDGEPLTVDDQLRLDTDPSVQRNLIELRTLFDELAVARLSQPSAAAISRYVELFAQIQIASKPSLIGGVSNAFSGLVEKIQATLTWDSRQQLAMQGARSVAGQSYRLLYSAEGADIEMLVEPEGNLRHITGEVMPIEDAQVTPSAPLLLHLLQPQSGIAFADATSDVEGTFRLAPVEPGRYKLLVTPSQGSVLEVASLEIT